MPGLLTDFLYQMLSICWRPASYLYAFIATTIEPTTAPAKAISTSSRCRYRLDDATSDTCTLPDGRQLGYAQYGSLAGRAVMYLHGLPGSRIEAASFDELAVQLDARIIAVDRPGIGWSSLHPNRTLLDHAGDIQHLANHLKLDEYGVLVRTNTSLTDNRRDGSLTLVPR